VLNKIYPNLRTIFENAYFYPLTHKKGNPY